MGHPVVSVLMTSYNREKLISKSIESVLASTLSDFELIIVDDCSVDSTFDIALGYQSRDSRVKVYRNERNLGDYINRNMAASYATGTYLKYLDSDDLIYPFGLHAFVDSMEKYPDAAFGVCSSLTNVNTPFPVLMSPEEAYEKHFFRYGILDKGPSGTIVRRNVFEELGGFSGKRYIGDQEFTLKVAARYPILELHATLVFWRKHEGQEYAMGLGDISSGYFVMELPLLEAVLNDDSCPLDKEKRAMILRRRRREYMRALVKNVLKTGEASKAFSVYQQLNLSLFDAF